MYAQSFVNERLDSMAQAAVDVCGKITGMPLQLPVINQMRASLAKVQYETSKVNFQLLNLAYRQLTGFENSTYRDLGADIEMINLEIHSPIRRQVILDRLIEEAFDLVDSLQGDLQG